MRLHYFQQFLNFWWLRPESAMFSALQAESSYRTLNCFGNGHAAIDISCGDGIYSFITLGGEIGPTSDAFLSIRLGDTFRKGNFDSFDHFDDSYSVDIKKYPEKHYEYGTDWKENLLKKARKLDLYKKDFLHDNNYKMPFDNEVMRYIYTNATYWVENFVYHINDIVRITQPGGCIVLHMMTNHVTKLTSREYIPFMGERFHNIIDAGRLSTWKGLKSKDEYLKIIEKIKDVDIYTIEPIFGGIPGMIWDIGLRPLFNPLTKMANLHSKEDRIKIKEEWCSIFINLFEEFLNNYKADDLSAFYYLIVLKKK
ncbi:MAG: hypothetical protein HQL06_03675 [Nitrospirae bacterium]|nr:hypothetical protein [Nitrospirota bacterium]